MWRKINGYICPHCQHCYAEEDDAWDSQLKQVNRIKAMHISDDRATRILSGLPEL